MPEALSAGELTVRVVSTTGDLDKDVQRKVNTAAKAGAQEAEKGTRNIAGKMRSIGTGMSLGVTLPILALGQAAKNSASDVIEGTNKVRVVFGEAAQSVEMFAASSAKIGIARSEALAAAGAFGNMFRTVGLANETSAVMSTRLTTLAADLGSFHNALPVEALEAMRSGLNGESEPLRRFGVFLSEARVQAEALASGIAKPVKNMAAIRTAQLAVEEAAGKAAEATKKHGAESLESRKAFDAYNRVLAKLRVEMGGQTVDLTEAQKTQARYNLILKDTKLAHGDVARSASTSAAVQESIAKAQAENARAALGKALIPLSISASKAVGGLADKFSDLSPAGQRNVVVTAGLLAVLGPLLAVMGNVAKVAQFAARVIRAEATAKIASAVASKVLAAATWLWNAALSANPVVLVVAGLAALAVGLVVAYKRSDTFRAIVQRAFAAVAGAARTVWSALRTVGGAIATVVGGVVRVLTPAFNAVRTALSVLAAVAVVQFRLMMIPLQLLGRLFGHLFGKVVPPVLTGLGRVIGQVFGAARLVVTAAVNVIRTVVTAAFAVLGRVVPPIARAIGGSISGAFRAARAVVVPVVEFVSREVRRVFGALRDGLRTIMDQVKRVITGAFEAVKEPVLGVGRFLVGVLNRIIRAINGVRIKVPRVDLPLGGTVGGQEFGFSIPEIPSFAAGALVKARRGGVLARIAEAGEDEVVAPLSRLEAMMGPRVVLEQTVNNPRPETPSESAIKTLRWLALAGMGGQWPSPAGYRH